GNDLHEISLAELSSDWPKNPRASWIVCVVDDHGRVFVERDRRTVVAPVRLARPDDHRLDDLTFLDRALRGRCLHGSRDHIAHAPVAALRAALHADAEDLARAGVVRDTQPGFLLDHRSPPMELVPASERPVWQGRREGS